MAPCINIRGLLRRVVVFGLVLTSACSIQDTSVSYQDETATSFDNPGTLVVADEPPVGGYLLDIGTTVAFLDSCIANSGLVGPCHCASDLLVYDVDIADVIGLEDRMSAFNKFPPELAGLLVQCRGAARPAEWSPSTKELYLSACSHGSDRLDRLCRCSASRAADVIPEERLSEFLSATDLRPNMVDLINTCL
ncbi:MAG: hypothetical protein P8J75_05640 [Actinomycetota bacterium]|jgi:hypothetical protein|nr:hypothetical protein [Actinomycetota bacterium]